jgi:ABC-type antimicrobial peptide transport system permease subunit
LNPVGEIRNYVFKNYAQPGDQMIISFDPSKLAVISLTVNTYMGETKDPVTLAVQMALLPDGTSHVQQTVLNVVAKEVVVTTTNSNYQKLAGY